jgi:pimeloyl-ACP methyl ester carboxylesterase
MPSVERSLLERGVLGVFHERRMWRREARVIGTILQPTKVTKERPVSRPFSRLTVVVAAIMSLSGSMDAQTLPAMDLTRWTKAVGSNGFEFPVADVGSGSPVLFLHGFPDDRTLWRFQAEALVTAGFRVIAPDLRGFGDAPRPLDPKDYGLSIAAQDVLGILDALDLPRVQLVAHDWGAAVGWRLAAEHPDRITRYVAMSVGAPGARTTIEQREKSWYMLFFRQTGVAEAQLTQNNWALFREWARDATDLDRWIERLSRPGALTSALNWYRASGGPPTALAGLPPPAQCPVLGIWSEGDHYLTEYPMKSSGERVKGEFRYEHVAGASHWMMVDQPARINELLLGFLRK